MLKLSVRRKAPLAARFALSHVLREATLSGPHFPYDALRAAQCSRLCEQVLDYRALTLSGYAVACMVWPLIQSAQRAFVRTQVVALQALLARLRGDLRRRRRRKRRADFGDADEVNANGDAARADRCYLTRLSQSRCRISRKSCCHPDCRRELA